MLTPESRIRKSNRQPVPNPIYIQGITQLKNENAARCKKKPITQEPNQSYEEDRNYNNNSYEPSSAYEGKEQYLPCKMPNGGMIRVKFVIDGRRDEKKKEVIEVVGGQQVAVQKQVVQTPVVQKKATTTNLLNIFIEAIDNAAIAQELDSQPPQPQKQTSSVCQKQRGLSRQKRVRAQEEGYIKKVILENGHLVFEHSELKELSYEVDWTSQQDGEQGMGEGMEGEGEREREMEKEELRRKLEAIDIVRNYMVGEL